MENTQGPKVFYTNSVKVSMSNFDVVVDFRFNLPSLEEVDKEQIFTSSDPVRMIMSPEHYRAFVKVAVDQLKKFDELNQIQNSVQQSELVENV